MKMAMTMAMKTAMRLTVWITLLTLLAANGLIFKRFKTIVRIPQILKNQPCHEHGRRGWSQACC